MTDEMFALFSHPDIEDIALPATPPIDVMPFEFSEYAMI